MKVLTKAEVKQVSGGWAWVAVGAAVSGASYLSQKNKKKSVKGFAIAVATGAVGGGATKVAGALWKAGSKVMASVQVANATAMGVASSNNPY